MTVRTCARPCWKTTRFATCSDLDPIFRGPARGLGVDIPANILGLRPAAYPPGGMGRGVPPRPPRHFRAAGTTPMGSKVGHSPHGQHRTRKNGQLGRRTQGQGAGSKSIDLSFFLKFDKFRFVTATLAKRCVARAGQWYAKLFTRGPFSLGAHLFFVPQRQFRVCQFWPIFGNSLCLNGER